MEKKTYIKPEIEVIETELTEMLAMSFFEEEVETETEQLVIVYKRRGKWGDLWYVEEEE
ncbi:MAG: hypothetical protein IKJ18_05965 [Bacteroidaceae bacterium]|nr:hypothetical protein [Bacteroidaceae bacterium]